MSFANTTTKLESAGGNSVVLVGYIMSLIPLPCEFRNSDVSGAGSSPIIKFTTYCKAILFVVRPSMMCLPVVQWLAYSTTIRGFNYSRNEKMLTWASPMSIIRAIAQPVETTTQ